MDKINDAIFLREFFPEKCLKITEINQQENQVRIYAKSITTQCRCPKCGTLSTIYHGTYTRRVQDLPILGKNVRLEIKAREYRCANDDCDATTIAESFDGFLDPYSRLTKRCADFICMLALETSCEGCSRICDKLGIRISGDSVIRLLIKRYESLGAPVVGEVVGVDDFAYKKRNTYGTIIVDERTHTPVTLLDGRDGESLREWLKNNKHIKVITRDRASAYAKVIAEELPDAMQVADRFHLQQNLLEAVKKALNQHLPATITIPHEVETRDFEDPCKKNRCQCG